MSESVNTPEIHVLVVDDEPENVEFVSRVLRARSNWHVTAAASSQEGLSILSEQKIDIVVLDQRMPAMTGTELIKQADANHVRFNFSAQIVR